VVTRLMRIILLLVGSIFMGLLPVHAQGNPWEDVGGGINSNGDAIETSMAIAPDGTPYVAWSGSGFHVHRFNGTIWEDISETLGSGPGDCKFTGSNGDFHIAIGSDGIPYLAWQSGINGTAIWYIYVCRYNGANWEQIGGSSASGSGVSNNPYDSRFPDIAVDNLNRPYVVWTNGGSTGNSTSSGIHVRRFNGTSWEEVGVDSTSTTTGGISQGQGPGSHPQIAIDLNGTPYVAWICNFIGASYQVCIRRFNGTIWEEVTPGSATFPNGMSHTTGSADYPSLEIGPGGEPYIAWQQSKSNGSWDIYIRRFNGTDWEEIEEGSASGGGISNTQHTSSIFPSLTFTGDGAPYVTWTEDTRGYTAGAKFSLWVRRFNGTIWEETYPGSASYTGPGVDDSVVSDVPASLESDQLGRAYAIYSRETATGKQLQVRALQYSSPQAFPSLNYQPIPDPVLTWSPVTWAHGYAIEISDSTDFTNPLRTGYDLSPQTLAYSVTDLRSGTYYWRISARISDSQLGRWSPIMRFIVRLP
jgi:hypothetical protein